MLFSLVLLYIVVYFLQPGSRWAFIGALRFELLLGTLILAIIFSMKHHLILKMNKYNKTVLIFFIAICLSFLGAVYTHTASHAITVLIRIMKCFAMYLMIIATVDTEKKLKIFMFVYLSMIALLFTEPLLLSLKGENLYNWGGVTHLYGVGQFAHYNGLGTITVTNLPFFIQIMFFYKRKWLFALIFFAFTVVGTITMIKTGSRTAYVGFMVLGLMTVWLSKYRIASLIAVCILAVFIFAMMPQEYQDRLNTIKETQDVISGEQQHGSMHARWEIIQHAWEIFIDYPIIGCGLDSFYQLRQLRFKKYQQTHNLYMQILTNTGVVGMFGFLTLVGTMWRSLKSARLYMNANDLNKSFVYRITVATSMFVAIRLIVGLFTHSLYSHAWWVAMGFTYAIANILSTHQTKVART